MTAKEKARQLAHQIFGNNYEVMPRNCALIEAALNEYTVELQAKLERVRALPDDPRCYCNDTCGNQLTGDACDCWKAKLRAALADEPETPTQPVSRPPAQS